MLSYDSRSALLCPVPPDGGGERGNKKECGSAGHSLPTHSTSGLSEGRGAGLCSLVEGYAEGGGGVLAGRGERGL